MCHVKAFIEIKKLIIVKRIVKQIFSEVKRSLNLKFSYQK